MNVATPVAATGWKRLLSGEIGLGIGAVLLFAALAFGLLRWYFPQGTGVEAELAGGLEAMTGQGREIGTSTTGAGAGMALRIGVLREFRNAVQWRSAREVAWQNASRGVEFREQDALQTGPRSYAVVRIEDGGEMTLAARSLVVFAGDMARGAGGTARPVTLVMQGELSGEVSSGAEPAQVRLKDGALSVSPAAGETAEYSVRINDNDSATISILRGRGEYSRAGATTAIASRQSLVVDKDGRQIALVDMPPAPAPVAPEADLRVGGRGGQGLVDFAWQPVTGVEGYRIIIARDRKLRDRLVDESVAETQLRRASLPTGEYYWSVQGQSGWTLGEASRARRLVLSDDMDPPELALDATPPVATGTTFTIAGRTEPGARVFVAGEPAVNSGGTFSHEVQLVAGANVIVVESVDAVGNVAYASVMITAQGGS
jgi:hypothetical protein